MQLLIAIDQMLNAILGGWADETLSARAYRQQHKRRWAIVRSVIDSLFFWQDNHCQSSYQHEFERRGMPSAYR